MLTHLRDPYPRDPLVQRSFVITAEILDVLGLLLNLGMLEKVISETLNKLFIHEHLSKNFFEYFEFIGVILVNKIM